MSLKMRSLIYRLHYFSSTMVLISKIKKETSIFRATILTQNSLIRGRHDIDFMFRILLLDVLPIDISTIFEGIIISKMKI